MHVADISPRSLLTPKLTTSFTKWQNFCWAHMIFFVNYIRATLMTQARHVNFVHRVCTSRAHPAHSLWWWMHMPSRLLIWNQLYMLLWRWLRPTYVRSRKQATALEKWFVQWPPFQDEHVMRVRCLRRLCPIIDWIAATTAVKNLAEKMIKRTLNLIQCNVLYNIQIWISYFVSFTVLRPFDEIANAVKMGLKKSRKTT